MTTSSTDIPWIDDSQIDPAWINKKMPMLQNISKCTAKDISNDARKGDKIKDGATLLLELTSSQEEGKQTTTTMVLKQETGSQLGLEKSKQLGIAREALFYNQLCQKIKLGSNVERGNDDKKDQAPCIPKIYYANGNMSDGSKTIFMEDLSGKFIDSGILFGPGNPNNWSRDLEAKIAKAYPQSSPPTSFEVANETFLAIADLHAAFWRDTELLDEKYNWLRGSSWITGKDKDSWTGIQGYLQNIWNNLEDIDSRLQWDPLVKKILDKAVDGISWEAQLNRLNAESHFCLTHGKVPFGVLLKQFCRL